MEHNHHEIETLEDIRQVVNSENKERFLKDFAAYLDLWLLATSLGEAAGAEIKHDKFIWIDDNQHDIRVSVGVELAEKQ